MKDNNMIALAEIRNSYSLKKYGNLISEQIALLKYDDLCISIIEENEELKKQLSNSHQIKNQQKEFIEWLEGEKDRLAKECSHTYEDSLGRMLYVNEDIYNEVNKILSKYKGIIGVNGD